MRVPPPPPAALLIGRPTGMPPALPGRRRTARAGRALLVGFLVLLLVLAGLLVAAVIAAATGLLGFAVGLLLAVLPVGPVVGAFLWADRLEPEPPPLLAFLFAWGAAVAALAASLINSTAVGVLRADGTVGSGDALATTAVLVAPAVEEAAKGAGVLAIVLLRRWEFDGILDGIVCAGVVGVGFAFTENVLYFGRAYLMGEEVGGPGGGVTAAGATFVFRGVLAPFAHPMFTALTGIGLGIAAHTRLPALRVLAPLAGFAGAVALHAAWNFSAVAGPTGFLTTYLSLMAPLFLAAVGLVLVLASRERRLVARALPAYAASGWLPPYDVAMLASLPGRRQARLWARSRAGVPGVRAMRDYQRAATELAFLRDRAERLGPDPAFPVREQALLAALAGARTRLAPALRGPDLPG